MTSSTDRPADMPPASDFTKNFPVPPDTAPAKTQVDALRLFLETDPRARVRGPVFSSFGGPVFCGVDVLGSSQDGREIYTVAACSEWGTSDGVLGEQSGFSGLPIRFTVAGAGAATTVETIDAAGDGSAFAEKTRAMFPADLAAAALRPTDKRRQAINRAVADRARRALTDG